MMEKMDTTMLVLFAVATGFALVYAGKPDLTLNPPNELKEGDTLEITCKVPDKKLFHFVKLYRQIGNTQYTISTNENIEEKMSDNGRYQSYDYSETQNVATLNFRISDIQGKDGGTIGCMHYPSKESASEFLNIHVSPKNIRFTQLNSDGTEMPLLEGEAIQFTKDKLNTLSCKVDVDGDHTGLKTSVEMNREDITSRFRTDFIEDREDKGDGFLHRLYTRELEYTTETPNPDDNKKTVTCRAEMPHFPPVEVSAVIEIRYPPELNCNQQWFVKIGSKNVQIACRGKMNPGPSVRSWSWGKMPNRTILTNDDTDGAFTAGMKELGNDEYEFTLDISEVTEDTFHKYKLEVSNDVGEVELPLRLYEEGKPIPPGDEIGGAASVQMCIGTLVSLMIVSLVLRS